MHGTTPPAFVAAIASGVRDAGGRALVVGGWVRDRLLERTDSIPKPEARSPGANDIDMEVFGIPPEKLPGLLAAFGRVEAVGQSFPVYKVVGCDGVAIDVALPRRESKQGRGHKGFDVRGDPFMSLDEAARRRDFTINAISWDPLTGEYVDPVDGRADLERRLLRAVDAQTFGDDSLRALRAVQFAARFDFTPRRRRRPGCAETSDSTICPPNGSGASSKNCSYWHGSRQSGFALARDLGIVDQVLPEMLPLIGCEQEPEWHPEGDVWIHTLMVIDRARESNDDLDRPRLLTVMLGAVCHDLGKPATTALHRRTDSFARPRTGRRRTDDQSARIG